MADVSSVVASRSAYSMLLTRGLIRVGIGVPSDAEFELIDVDDPYGYASAVELSLFRRPLPATNLAFLATVMWDGRQTFPDRSIHFDLSDQANGATLGHAAAVNPLTQRERASIVNFELSLTSAAARTPDMPLYTFRNKATGEILQTTDPGRALITGKWKHMSLFKGPILRGLAARPPYFHNGFATTLADVVEFYNRRFNIGLTAQEKSDLLAFLRAL
jgi:hypothetical protein